MNDDGDDDSARFRADLARAVAASKATASPTTSIISLTSDSDMDQGIAPAAAAQSGSTFLTERAQLEQERLARLKRLRGDSEDPHRAVPPPQKRPTTNGAPASQGSPRRKEKEAADNSETGEAEVFWDGELRQTANKHVEPRRNGEDGKLVFRLSQIIGDVRFAFSHFLVSRR